MLCASKSKKWVVEDIVLRYADDQTARGGFDDDFVVKDHFV